MLERLGVLPLREQATAGSERSETIKSSQHKITTASAIEITVETEIRHSLAKVDDGDPVVLAEQDVLRSARELGLR